MARCQTLTEYFFEICWVFMLHRLFFNPQKKDNLQVFLGGALVRLLSACCLACPHRPGIIGVAALFPMPPPYSPTWRAPTVRYPFGHPALFLRPPAGPFYLCRPMFLPPARVFTAGPCFLRRALWAGHEITLKELLLFAHAPEPAFQTVEGDVRLRHAWAAPGVRGLRGRAGVSRPTAHPPQPGWE